MNYNLQRTMRIKDIQIEFKGFIIGNGKLDLGKILIYLQNFLKKKKNLIQILNKMIIKLNKIKIILDLILFNKLYFL